MSPGQSSTAPLSSSQIRLRHHTRNEIDGLRRVGHVLLDVRRRVADAGHGPVHLSEKEFLVLQHLMRRSPEVCGREELLADVWGLSFDPGSNIVEVCVGRLRQKLGADIVETVRNVGYRFAHPTTIAPDRVAVSR